MRVEWNLYNRRYRYRRNKEDLRYICVYEGYIKLKTGRSAVGAELSDFIGSQGESSSISLVQITLRISCSPYVDITGLDHLA